MNMCTLVIVKAVYAINYVSMRSVLPLLAFSTCSSSSGNFRICGYISSHFSAKKCISVVFWSVDFVSRSYKKKSDGDENFSY